jgi:hypothetical protein
MGAVSCLICRAHCLSSRILQIIVDAFSVDLVTEEVWDGLSIERNAWRRIVRRTGAGVVEGGLEGYQYKYQGIQVG